MTLHTIAATRISVVLVLAGCLAGCRSAPARSAATPGTPPSRTPAWGEVRHDNRAQDQKAIDAASRGVTR